jgi:OTU domain-containing protein 3
MGTPGTYGGHVELSAFAHLMKRNVKVIQPGLVYVIEWNAGGEVEDLESSSSLLSLDRPQRHETLTETANRTVYVA